MKLQLRTKVRPIKAGTEAHVPSLGLSTHGFDQVDAIERLEKVVLTWCYTLMRVRWLEHALQARGILWEELSHDGVEVQLVLDSES